MSLNTISNCLSVEASAIIKGVSVSAASGFCKKKSNGLKTGATFSQAFSDRTVEVNGGDGDVGSLMFDPHGAAAYKKWLSSLKRVPGVVSYQISPLHLLVRNTWRSCDRICFHSVFSFKTGHVCRSQTTPS